LVFVEDAVRCIDGRPSNRLLSGGGAIVPPNEVVQMLTHNAGRAEIDKDLQGKKDHDNIVHFAQPREHPIGDKIDGGQ
jgi:hypothetical protein